MKHRIKKDESSLKEKLIVYWHMLIELVPCFVSIFMIYISEKSTEYFLIVYGLVSFVTIYRFVTNIKYLFNFGVKNYKSTAYPLLEKFVVWIILVMTIMLEILFNFLVKYII